MVAPAKPAEDEWIFVSMKNLLSAKANQDFATIIKRSEAVVMNAPASGAPKGHSGADLDPCLGFYNGSFGHVFFRNGDYAFDVFESSYLEEDDVSGAYIRRQPRRLFFCRHPFSLFLALSFPPFLLNTHSLSRKLPRSPGWRRASASS